NAADNDDSILVIKVNTEEESNKSKNIPKETINITLQQYNKLKKENAQLKKNMIKKNQEIKRIRKENLIDKVPKTIDRANFVNSNYIIRNRSLKTERRILANLEIKRLLDKLNSIDPSLANKWHQFFENCSNISDIE
ncbi:2944_t:CDS:2, partial [Racocetra fulgida]